MSGGGQNGQLGGYKGPQLGYGGGGANVPYRPPQQGAAPPTQPPMMGGRPVQTAPFPGGGMMGGRPPFGTNPVTPGGGQNNDAQQMMQKFSPQGGMGQGAMMGQGAPVNYQLPTPQGGGMPFQPANKMGTSGYDDGAAYGGLQQGLQQAAPQQPGVVNDDMLNRMRRGY